MSHKPSTLFRRENPAADNPVYDVLNPDLYPVIVLDPVNGTLLHVTPSAAQLLGYDPGSLDGKPAAPLFGETGVAPLASLYSRMAAAGNGMAWGQELALIGASGEASRLFCTMRLPPNGNGAPPDEACQIIALAPGEIGADGRISSCGPNPHFVMDAMKDSIFEFDTDRRVFYYSRLMAGILGDSGVENGRGLPLEEWMGAVHPEDAARIAHRWRRLLKDGTRYYLTYRFRDARGEWHWIVSGIHAILNDPQGRPRRVLGFHLDITSAMDMEKSATDTGELFQTIFNNVGVGIAVCDVNGVVRQANSAIAQILRLTREELVGRTLESMAAPNDVRDFVEARLRLSRVGRRERLIDKRIIRADGTRIWVNVTATLSAKVCDRERYLIAIVEDVTESRAEREKLQYEATHDVMTGGWNRWVLLERLEQHVHISQRHRLSMAFCICDLDHFKNVNDIHGHLVGDQVLVRFVQLLREAVRETEVVGRYGGEEFAIVFPSTPVEGARQSLQRALERLRREEFSDHAGLPFHVTATFGISGVTRDCTARQVVSWADEALYEGKGGGRNRIVVAKPPEGEAWL